MLSVMYKKLNSYIKAVVVSHWVVFLGQQSALEHMHNFLGTVSSSKEHGNSTVSSVAIWKL